MMLKILLFFPVNLGKLKIGSLKTNENTLYFRTDAIVMLIHSDI